MNDDLPVRWSALTHPPTTILSGPTPIQVLDAPAAIDAAETETKRPAPATIRTTKPASATRLTSLGRPIRGHFTEALTLGEGTDDTVGATGEPHRGALAAAQSEAASFT